MSRLRHGLGLFFLLTLACPGMGAEGPEAPPIIHEIHFEGVSPEVEEQLRDLMESRPGQPFDAYTLREDMKRLSAEVQELEARQEMGPEGLVLLFSAQENPMVKAIEIIGNTQIKSKDLKKRLRLKVGDPLTPAALADCKSRLLREYQSQGYMKAVVEVDTLPAPEGVLLQLRVREGVRLKMDKVRLEGNEHFSDWWLSLNMESHGSWWLVTRYYDEYAFERDMEMIRQKYVGDGFFDVEVRRGQFLYSEEEKTVTPSIVISEGARYRLGEVLVEGATVFSPAELKAPFLKLQGKTFERESYSLAMERTRNLYADAGYISTTVQDRFEFDRQAGMAHLTLVVEEKGQVRVGEIYLQRPARIFPEERSWFGRMYDRISPPVEEEVVQREMALRKGGLFRKTLQDLSEQRLSALGVFEKVDVEPRATKDPAIYDAMVTVEEGVTGNLNLGLGYQESAGGYIWANFTERNLGGQADALRLGGLAGTESWEAFMAYTNRHLGDSRNSLRTEVAYQTTFQPGFIEKETRLDADYAIRPEPDIDDPDGRYPWTFHLRPRVGYVKTEEGHYDPEADFERRYGLAALRFDVERDKREWKRLLRRRYYETGGHQEKMSYEIGQADGFYNKIGGEWEGFVQLTDRLIATSRFQAQLLLADVEDIGPSERLYMGGSQDVRGFRYRRAGPHDRKDDDVPLGGATKLTLRNELRYPLLDALTAIAFLDAGMLDGKIGRYGSTRVSAGLGFQVRIRQVEVGIDFAGPLVYQDGDETRYLHFYARNSWGY